MCRIRTGTNNHAVGEYDQFAVTVISKLINERMYIVFFKFRFLAY